MVKRPGLTFRVRACPRCGGDAYLEAAGDNEWRCLQCGRSVPVPLGLLASALGPGAAPLSPNHS